MRRPLLLRLVWVFVVALRAKMTGVVTLARSLRLARAPVGVLGLVWSLAVPVLLLLLLGHLSLRSVGGRGEYPRDAAANGFAESLAPQARGMFLLSNLVDITQPMLVAGMDVSEAAMARLAVQLNRAGYKGLAGYIGHAIDHHHPDLGLFRRDYFAIIQVLELDPIPDLEPVRSRLLDELLESNPAA